MSSAEEIKSRGKELVVVAIDFGTSYSGYAFSFRPEFEKDPTKISANNVWSSGSKNLVSLKAPTALLLHWEEDRQEFTAEEFGYDAENKYEELVMDDDHDNYYLVKNFKTELYNKSAGSGLGKHTTYDIDQGKSIKLKRLFCLAIQFLKKHAGQTFQKRTFTAELKEDEIRWVLTVPAIWTDAAKQIMREAAIEAGIKSEKLTLVLEPEAASLFYLNLPSLTSRELMLKEGTKYMVVDAGGGTVDINIHQVKEGRTLVEIQEACGGSWGGTTVDYAFTTMITEVVGKEVFDAFSKKYRDDFLDLCRDFEAKKRKFDPKAKRVNLRLPASLLETYTSIKRQSISEAFSRSKYRDSVNQISGKLQMDASVMQGFFHDSCDKIVTCVKEILASKRDDNIEAIVLVGGYGESLTLQNAIKTAFSTVKVIIPEEAGLAVLKGAVIYGHNPGAILSRVAQRTYGVDITPEFREGVHPESKKKFYDGKAHCEDVFCTIIQKGQNMKWGHPLPSHTFGPITRDSTEILFKVYGSTEDNPKFVTDRSCTCLGSLTVGCPNESSGLNRDVEITFQFDAQLKVTAVESATKKKTTALLDFYFD